MKRQHTVYLSLLIAALSALPALSQNPVKSIGDDNARLRTQEETRIHSFREIKGVVVDSLTHTPVQSALVSFFNSSDRVGHTSTDKNGRFRITDVSKDNLRVEITHLGYRIKVLAPNGPGTSLDMGRIEMAEDVKKIDELVVKARMNFFTIKGDTVVINPGAVKIMEGDMAIDILRRIPGVEVRGGHITVLGDQITATFVNGKPIYGGDNNKALNYVEARNVAGIEVYDEIDLPEYESTGKIKRRKVANINTFKAFTQNILADIFFNGGANTAAGPDGRHDFRYAGGGGGAFYSEKRRFNVDASTDNTYLTRVKYGKESHLNGTPTYAPNESMKRTTDVETNYQWETAERTVPVTLEDGRRIEKRTPRSHFGIGYRYTDTRDRSLTTRRLAYTPSPEFDSKIMSDTSSGFTRGKKHEVKFDMRRSGSLLQSLYATASTDANRSDNLRRSRLITDETATARTSVTGRSRLRTYVAAVGASLGKKFGQWSLYAHISGRYNYGDGNSIRMDTVAGSADRYSLVIPSLDSHGTVNSQIELGRTINKELRIGLSNVLNYSTDKTHSIATNELTGYIDSASTADYSAGNLDHSLQAFIKWNKGFDHTIMLYAGYDLSRLNQDDRFPANTVDRDLFINPMASLTANFTTASRTRISLYYTLRPLTPTINKLRNRIDTDNPLWLSAGNPSLKSSLQHDIRGSVSRHFTKSAVYATLSASFSYGSDITARRTRTFTEDTYLPAYGYTAVKGATLQDYVNLNGMYRFRIGPSVSFPIRALNTKVNASLAGTISSTPSMSGERRTDIKKTEGTFSLDFDANVSDKAEITLSTVTSLERNSNGSAKFNALRENLSALVRYDITNRLFLNTSYMLAFYDAGYRGIPTQHDNLLNVTAGVRLLRDRALNLSVSVYDILDSNNPFSATLCNDYIAEEWKQMYSRYFTFNISYRINRKR